MSYEQMPAPPQSVPHVNATYYNQDPQYAQYTQYAQYDPYAAQQQPSTLQSWFEFNNTGYIKGFVVGAGLALVLANPTVQRALVSGVVKLWTGMQGGVEEIKEHVKDIKAEISTKE